MKKIAIGQERLITPRVKLPDSGLSQAAMNLCSTALCNGAILLHPLRIGYQRYFNYFYFTVVALFVKRLRSSKQRHESRDLDTRVRVFNVNWKPHNST